MNYQAVYNMLYQIKSDTTREITQGTIEVWTTEIPCHSVYIQRALVLTEIKATTVLKNDDTADFGIKVTNTDQQNKEIYLQLLENIMLILSPSMPHKMLDVFTQELVAMIHLEKIKIVNE